MTGGSIFTSKKSTVTCGQVMEHASLVVQRLGSVCSLTQKPLGLMNNTWSPYPGMTPVFTWYRGSFYPCSYQIASTKLRFLNLSWNSSFLSFQHTYFSDWQDDTEIIFENVLKRKWPIHSSLPGHFIFLFLFFTYCLLQAHTFVQLKSQWI